MPPSSQPAASSLASQAPATFGCGSSRAATFSGVPTDRVSSRHNRTVPSNRAGENSQKAQAFSKAKQPLRSRLVAQFTAQAKMATR